MVAGVFDRLGLTVLERGWLSSNNIVFAAGKQAGAAIVDTGYDTHSEQTLALVTHALEGQALERIVNTHLHSDHCGGNAALRAAHEAEIWVPEASFDAARNWDCARLTFDATGQHCEPFAVHAAISDGQYLQLGTYRWQVIAAPGHDAEAVMLFQPESRVLISADALWEERLAIIFPELDGAPGFGPARDALACIEALEPAIVIPGHGRPFTDVVGALTRSRQRLDQFQAFPEKHMRYAMRALVMFHMLERQRRTVVDLLDWMLGAAVFVRVNDDLAARGDDPRSMARATIDSLCRDGVLGYDESSVWIP
jgi:glyoxylase-like metal-dependent hydrolase (beta-lactamase superfamily II)